jgi:hypothetical protein
MAKGFDLVSDLGPVLELRLNSEVCSITAVVEELNRAWVAVVVNEPPSSLYGLHSLVGFTVQVNFFTGHNQVCSLETALRLRSDHCKKRNTSYSPLGCG